MAFKYSASAVGVGAVLTAPAPNAESWAPCCLPIIGGRSGSVAGPVVWPTPADPVLRFDLARTEVTGVQVDPQQFRTRISIEVLGLNILNRVRGDIKAQLQFTYRLARGANRLSDSVGVLVAPRNPYTGISVLDANGRNRLPRRTTFQAGIFGPAGKNFLQFRDGVRGGRGSIIDGLRPRAGGGGRARGGGNQHLRHAHGQVFTALAEPTNLFVYNDPNFGLLRVDNELSVYLGEWWAEPYRQSFTLLRVELNRARDARNPRGSRFTGQIVIDEEENGRD